MNESANLEITDGELGNASIETKSERPATEEQGYDESGAYDHGSVFSHEEHREFHRGIFGVVTTNEFRFALRKVERHTVGFRENRDCED